MKKITALLIAALLALSLCGCEQIEQLKQIELPTPSVEPSETPEPTPEASEEPEATPEPTPESAEPSSYVTISIGEHKETYYAPDDENQLILDFSYETPTVHIYGNDAASEKINDFIAAMDEEYYTGSNYAEGGYGVGINGMLDMAYDNLSYVRDNNIEANLTLASNRTVLVARADEKLISLLYNDYSYTGGVHGIYGYTGYIFDTETGEQLTLDKLAPDLDAFKTWLTAAMVEKVNSDDELKQSLTVDDVETALAALIREGSWYLDDEGLTVFSSVYEIAPYAAGVINFKFSYDEIAPYIDSKWLPAARTGSGELEALALDALPEGTEIIDKVTVDSGETQLCIKVSGAVYNVSVCSVEYADFDSRFYTTGEHWYCSYMKDSAIQLETMIPDGIPNLMVSYTDADGVNHSKLVSQSGMDGSFLLIDDNIEVLG